MTSNANSPTLDWLQTRVLPQGVDVPSDVRTLTAAVAAGDTEAFARFFGVWFDSMLAEARRLTGRDESFCLDVVQESLLRVIRAIRPMETRDDVRRWLRVVVATTAYDMLRREARRRRAERRAVSERLPHGGPSDDLETRLQWLRRQLRSLDDDNVQLLLMRHRFGWTLRQIGEAVGQSAGAIDGRLRRLAAALRRKAKEAPDE